MEYNLCNPPYEFPPFSVDRFDIRIPKPRFTQIHSISLLSISKKIVSIVCFFCLSVLILFAHMKPLKSKNTSYWYENFVLTITTTDME